MAQVPQATPVPFGHLHIGEQVVGQADRLGPLQVGVTRYQGVGLGLGLGQQGPLKAQQGAIDQVHLLAQPEAQIRAHLVVATAARVQGLANRTEQLDQTSLHRKVHVFSLQTWTKIPRRRFLAHLLQAGHQLLGFGGGDHAHAAQHGGVGNRTIEILLQQLDIEADRGIEALNRRMEPLLETVAPARRPTASDPTRETGAKGFGAGNDLGIGGCHRAWLPQPLSLAGWPALAGPSP